MMYLALQSAICNLQSAICNLQSAICNLQSAICNLQSAIRNPQSKIYNSRMTPVVMIAGDGIGPEVTEATRQVLAACGARVDWVEAHAGLDAAQRFGDPLPELTL